jgi:uncharacterized protein YyaL (SSP411 family)
MKNMRLTALTVLALLASSSAAHATEDLPIAWQEWSEAAFERAQREHRFVLLDLGAVWCHWCHVMEETTYKDPRVVALLRGSFVPVRVDQDARPDLSNRYEDYGWPATIVFDAHGGEIVKFSGYIPPERMRSLLQAIVEDPTPGPSVRARQDAAPAPRGALSPELRQKAEDLLVSRYDTAQGGWGFAKKFIDWDAVEYSMEKARQGDRAAERRARETLDRGLKLIDPVWGGIYQYSDSGDWDHPHFEKIMSFEAECLRIYAQAYALWRDPAYLEAARNIERYLTAFLLGPGGAFYTSQNADLVDGEHAGTYFALGDRERRARGIPRVDTHQYARENAWAGSALLALHGATGDAAPLRQAAVTARWIVAERALPGGGFGHDATDAAGPYLGDSVAAGRAFLRLYAATRDRSWLAHAEAAAGFISARFTAPDGAGFVTAVAHGRLDRPEPQRDENILVARFGTLLARETGRPEHRTLALHALRWLAQPEVALRFETGGVLLADLEAR